MNRTLCIRLAIACISTSLMGLGGNFYIHHYGIDFISGILVGLGFAINLTQFLVNKLLDKTEQKQPIKEDK